MFCSRLNHFLIEKILPCMWLFSLLTSVQGNELYNPPAPQVTSMIIHKSQSLEARWIPINNPLILGYRVRLFEITPTILYVKVEDSEGGIILSENKEIPASLTNKSNIKKERAAIDVLGYGNAKVRIDNLMDDVLYEFTVSALMENEEGPLSSPKRFRIKGTLASWDYAASLEYIENKI